MSVNHGVLTVALTLCLLYPAAAQPGADRAIGSYQNARASVHSGDGDSSQAIRDAREALEQGVRSGDIGPELSRLLGQYLDELENHGKVKKTRKPETESRIRKIRDNRGSEPRDDDETEVGDPEPRDDDETDAREPRDDDESEIGDEPRDDDETEFPEEPRDDDETEQVRDCRGSLRAPNPTCSLCRSMSSDEFQRIRHDNRAWARIQNRIQRGSYASQGGRDRRSGPMGRGNTRARMNVSGCYGH